MSPGGAGDTVSNNGRLVLIGFCGLICLLVAVRVTLWPLGGWDTPFRWDWLARCLLAERSLDFYPPRTGDHFEIYPYADGIPPLVASVYWWLYAAVGRPMPALTAIPVAASFISLLGVVQSGGGLLWGNRGGWLAAALVAACPLVIWAVVIGQETGYTALSVAGQLTCGVAASRTGSRETAFGCGLFAALGCLSRDYGPALAICGVLVLAQTGRRLVPALLAGAAVALPWFLRNWWLTGNPVYSNPTPLGLPSNPVHVALIGTYAEVFSVFSYGRDDLFNLAEALATLAGAVILLGLVGAGQAGQAGRPLVATAVLTAGLWAWSTGFTAGGQWYSLRVLAPAMVALALLAPAATGLWRYVPAEFQSELRGVWIRRVLWTVAALIGGFAAAAAAVFPLDIAALPRAGGLAAIPSILISRRDDPLDDQGRVSVLVQALNGSSLPDSYILTDNSYLAVVLRHTGSRYRPMMVWSPDVRFLFDRGSVPHASGLTVDDQSVSACQYARRELAQRRVLLAMISTDFLHWRVLGTMPFFRVDEPTWQPAVTLEGDPPDAGIRIMPSVCRAVSR